MALSENIKNKIDEMRGNFPTEQALLLPLLHSIQEERGWISLESMKEAAEFLHLPLMKVREVVTFYTMYNLQPKGKYHICVCRTLSCYLLGKQEIVDYLQRELGIKPGDVSADGQFSLEEVECLGHCGTAPVVQVNGEFYENMNVDKLKELLATMK